MNYPSVSKAFLLQKTIMDCKAHARKSWSCYYDHYWIFFFKFQAHRYLKLKQSKDCFISYLFISLSAGPVIYPSQIAAARNSFLHFSIDLGASIIYAYKLSQQQILCKHVATLQLVQQSPRIHHRNRQMLNLNQLTGLLWEVRNKTQITFNH